MTKPPFSVTTKAYTDSIEAYDRLLSYWRYIERNLERIERGGWTPVCFAEFCESEEMEGEAARVVDDAPTTHTLGLWQEDDCRDARGFTTIRLVDPRRPNCPHGDTSVNPIATVYDDIDCAVIAAAPQLLEVLKNIQHAWDTGIDAKSRWAHKVRAAVKLVTGD